METITFEELMHKYDVQTEGMILSADVDKIVPDSILSWFRFIHRYYYGAPISKNHFNASCIIAERDIIESNEQHMINHLQFGFIRTFQTNNDRKDALWTFCAFQYIRRKMYGFVNEDPFGKTTIKLSQCNLEDQNLSRILADLCEQKFDLETLIKKWTKDFNLKSTFKQTTRELCQRTIDKKPSL